MSRYAPTVADLAAERKAADDDTKRARAEGVARAAASRAARAEAEAAKRDREDVADEMNDRREKETT